MIQSALSVWLELLLKPLRRLKRQTAFQNVLLFTVMAWVKVNNKTLWMKNCQQSKKESVKFIQVWIQKSRLLLELKVIQKFIQIHFFQFLDHNKRVFRSDGKNITNTGPGDIVGSKITRGDIPEFYQQAHNPLKGVPKMLQVDVLVNELKMTQSQLEKLNLMLSSMHQVSACTTSLPLPTYLADETAKRGMDIYNELYAMRNPPNRYDQPIPFAVKEIQSVDGIFNYGKLKFKKILIIFPIFRSFDWRFGLRYKQISWNPLQCLKWSQISWPKISGISV